MLSESGKTKRTLLLQYIAEKSSVKKHQSARSEKQFPLWKNSVLLKNFAVGLDLIFFSEKLSRTETVALPVDVADVLEDLVHGAQVVTLNLHIVGRRLLKNKIVT